MRRLALPLCLLIPFPAFAEDGPSLSGEVEIKLYADRAYRSSGSPTPKRSDLRTETEARIGLALGEGFSIQSVSKLEPVRDAGANRLFGDHGFYASELHADYDGEWFKLFAGKIHPRFGIAWDRAPGVYGKDFAEGYENVERLGVGASVKLETGSFGAHELAASVFKADDSFLSQSYFTRPGFGSSRLSRVGRNERRFGGVANTGGLESFTVALSGDEFSFLPNFSYHLAFAQQPSSADPDGVGGRTERGVAVAAQYAIIVSEDLKLTPLVEWVGQTNADGLDQDRRYLTLGAEATYKEWSLSALRTDRRTEARGAAAVNDALTTVSVGYMFDFGLALSLGWRRTRVAGIDEDSAGALAVYSLKF